MTFVLTNSNSIIIIIYLFFPYKISAHSALRCAGFCLYQAQIVNFMTQEQQDKFIEELCNNIRTAKDKVTCNLSLWCLQVQVREIQWFSRIYILL